MVRRAKLLALTCLASLGMVSLSSLQTKVQAQTSVATSYPSSVFQAGAASPVQAPANTSPAPEGGQPSSPVLLAPGSQSRDVMILQRQLQQLGYYKGPIDGSYGPSTRRAVQGFQQQAALPTTGNLDQLTWQQMQMPQLFPTNSASAPPTSAGPGVSVPAVPNTSTSTAPQNQPVPSEEANSSSGSSTASAPISAPTTNSVATPATPSAPETPITEPVAGGNQSALPSAGNPAESATSREGRLLWGAIALLSLLLVLVSTVLLAIFVWKRLQQRPRDPRLMPLGGTIEATASETEANPLIGNRSPAGGQADQQNNSLRSRWDSHKGAAEAGLLPLDVEETTRLSRVNITDQLVADLASQDSNQRHRTIWELGQRGSSTAIQPLVEAMIDADSKERSLILAALSEIGMRTLKPMNRALALSLQDENPEVRKNAIRDLTRVYDQISQMSQMLNRAVQDNDAEVQETAQWALDQLGRIRSLPSTALSGVDPSESAPQLPNDSSRTFLP
ncbi:MAG TPA: peptidoglycan-binding protein [Leptolyngbyaceae cyanobacterium]